MPATQPPDNRTKHDTQQQFGPIIGNVQRVRTMTADEYLCQLMERHPVQVTESFIATANARRRPPMTPAELADRINCAGAPDFAAGIRRLLVNLG